MTILQDLRHGTRLMLRNPGSAAVSVFTLALGIGLTGMVFSIVNGALLKGLPFEDSDRLMAVSRTDASRGLDDLPAPLHDFEQWRSEQTVFEGIASFLTGTFNVRGTEGAERFDGAWMTANAFDLLRARPILGRGFLDGEDAPGAALVAVVSHRFWQDRYEGDPAVLGQRLHINGDEATIVGVMEEGFLFPLREHIWLPDQRRALDFARGAPDTPSLRVFGRLAPGVSRDQANAQMSTIAARIAEAHPETHENLGVNVHPFTEAFIGREARQSLSIMLGAVFAVLLIACANVANLLLGRAALREKEIGIRSALGASRARVVLQFLTEPVALALVGGVVGLGLAWLGVRAFISAVPTSEPPFWVDFSMDGTVIGFVLAVTLLSILVAGLIPAVRASRATVNDILKDDSRNASSFRGGRLSRVLVITEVALSVTLLVGAGLMIRSVTELASMEFDFATEEIFTARLGLPRTDGEYSDPAARIGFFQEVEERLAADPSVLSVTLTSTLPGLVSNTEPFEIEGHDYPRAIDRPLARSAVITPSYFETFAVGVRDGRGFEPQDREEGLPVVVVNQSFADLHFPQGDAIGRRIRVGTVESQRPWLTIVGIAPDMHMPGVENLEPAGFYTLLAQSPATRFMSVAARGGGPPHALTPTVRRAVAAIDPDIPIYHVQSLAEGIHAETWFVRVFGAVFALMGGVALFLAAVGLYGVLSFSVSRRTREIGVRMALGAERRDVIRLIVRQGGSQLGIGLALGLVAAWGVSSLMESFILRVEPRDPFTFLSTALVLVVAGLAASWIPARRATRVDPIVAMRGQ
jgi:putative ABC transport system permease protein